MDKYWQLEGKSLRVYKNLEKQIEKVFRHSRQGSIKTRMRYKEGVKHFAKFVAETYNKQSLNNIRNSHLEAYVEQMQEARYSASYITTNLSAIRFFVDQIKDSNYIWNNERLGVVPRGSQERIGPTRSWTKNEVQKMQNIAREKDFDRIADMIKLGYLQGLRIHEITRLERVDLQRALRNGHLTVKGKGGLIRNVPVRNQESRDHIQKLYNQTEQRDWKVFVNENEKTHEVIKQVQNFIYNHREQVQEHTNNRADITFHGLRHTYAQERYKELRELGKSNYDARLTIANELGHFRVEITNTYLK